MGVCHKICVNALIWVVNGTSPQRVAELITVVSRGEDRFVTFAQKTGDLKLLALRASVSSKTQT